MKNFTIFLLALGVSLGALLSARAQTTPPADWAVACGPNTRPLALTVDAQGNSYVVGTFSGTITLGTTTLSATQPPPGSSYAQDTFLAKLNAQGQYQWAMQFGDGQDVIGSQVAVDGAGNVYITGGFNSYSIQVGIGGPVLYNSSANCEGFVTSFSAQTGQCQWARRFGGTGYDAGYRLTASQFGELYLVGETGSGVADFGPYTVPASLPIYKGNRSFVAKLTTSGTWLWVQQPVADDNFGIGRVVADGPGKFLVLCRVSSPGVTLGTTTVTVPALSGGSSGSDVCIVRFVGTTIRWVRQLNPAGGNSITENEVYDGMGNFYLVGSFTSQNVKIGAVTLTNTGPLIPPPIGPAPPTPNTDRYYNDAFAARIDTLGTCQWAVRWGSAGVNDYGNVPVLGYNNALWATYSSSGSRLIAHALATGASLQEYQLPSYQLAGDLLGRLYLYGGFTAASLTLGNQTITGTAGTPTGYVARLGQLPLSTRTTQSTSASGLQVWPTPGSGTGVWVQGAAAGQVVEVLDMLGRRVGGGTIPASGALRLTWPGAGLAPGVYVVRSGERSTRWVVE